MESLKPENNMIFTPVLDPEEIYDFTRALLEDTSALLEIFINVNASKASAYLKEDLDMIFGWIKDSIGLDTLNTVLKKGLCDWLRKAGTEAVDKQVSGLQARMNGEKEEVREAEGVRCEESTAVLAKGKFEQLQEEEKRLLRRRELLIEDLDRFNRVEPLLQAQMLETTSLEAATSRGLPAASIPVLLGTTEHHSLERPGGICGGVLSAFLQILVSQPPFRRDVHLGTDSKGESKTSESRFHSELRNVCALWEMAQDGVISLDMLIDKLPGRSKELSLQPADFTEFVATVLEENDALHDFWPLVSTDMVIWYEDAEGVRHQKVLSESTWYLHAQPTAGIPSLVDILKNSFYSEPIEDYQWGSDALTVTAQRDCYWKKQTTGDGRVAVMLNRSQIDFTSWSTCFNPSPCLIPHELSLKGFENIDQSPTTDELAMPESCELIYRPKGIITYRRQNIKDDDDVSMGSGGVYETYVEVDGLWWFCSEYKRVVRLIDWESVQKEVSKSVLMILFDSSTLEPKK